MQDSGLEKSVVWSSGTSRYLELSILTCLLGKGSASHLPTKSKLSNLRLAQGKQNLRTNCPKDKPKSKFES